LFDEFLFYYTPVPDARSENSKRHSAEGPGYKGNLALPFSAPDERETVSGAEWLSFRQNTQNPVKFKIFILDNHRLINGIYRMGLQIPMRVHRG
jgi:hypothetical protein